MSQSTSNVLNTIRALTDDIRREKRAAAGLGETTHPVMDADNNEQPAHEGSRSAENERDVKDNVPANIAGSAASSLTDTGTDKLPNLGLTQSATGEAPEVEDDFGGSIKDPGTESVATTDDGVKYGEWSFDQIAKHAADLGNRILADITLDGRGDTKTAKTAKSETTPEAKAAAAGYADATQAEAVQNVDSASSQLIYNTIKEARLAADLAAEYTFNHIRMAKKAAEDEDAALAALMAQQGGGGDPMAEDPGIPVEGGGDVAPFDPADDGGDGEELGDPEANAGINGAVDDLGLSPDVLAAVIELLESQESGGGGEEQAPPAIADLPPKTAGLLKRAAIEAVVSRRNGGYTARPPKTAREQKVRAQMKAFLSEVIGRID